MAPFPLACRLNVNVTCAINACNRTGVQCITLLLRPGGTLARQEDGPGMKSSSRAAAYERPLLPVVASAAASVITGTALVATRYVVPHTDGLTVATLRYLIAAACLVPLVPVFFRFNIALRDLIPIAVL